jgi:hypothetical protein
VHDGQGMSVFTLNMLTVLLRLLEKNKIVSVDCKLVREYLIYIYIKHVSTKLLIIIGKMVIIHVDIRSLNQPCFNYLKIRFQKSSCSFPHL